MLDKFTPPKKLLEWRRTHSNTIGIFNGEGEILSLAKK
jgi:hypothetical protein